MNTYFYKLFRQLPAAILLIVMMTACSPEAEIWRATATLPPPIILTTPTLQPTTTSLLANPLVGTGWILQSFGPVGEAPAVLPDTLLTVSFTRGGRAEGSGGCNDFIVDYTMEDERLEFGRVFSTLNSCEEAGVAEQELLYFQALQNAAEFQMETAGQLTIFYNDSMDALNFVKPGFESPAPTSTPAPTETVVAPIAADARSSAENPIRISFERGATGAEIEASIESGDIAYYILEAMAGQEMTVNIVSPEDTVLLSVIGEDGTELKVADDGLSSWNGMLPATQDYYIQAESIGPPTTYSLIIEIAPLNT